MINKIHNQHFLIKKKEQQSHSKKTFKANRVAIRANNSNDGYICLKPNDSTGRETIGVSCDHVQ